MRALLIVAFGALLPVLVSTPAAGGHPQVVVDRVLSRTYGELLTLSDVRQAIELRLLRTAPQTEAQAQTDLENRRLILFEVERLPSVEPTPAALTRQRSDWERRMGAGTPLADRLNGAGMTEQELAAWLRDDVRIDDYLSQRFSATEESDRPAAVAVWVSLLRQRAGLR